MIPVSVNYVPVVLRSMSEICRAFGVGCEQVRKWVAADAPIAVDRDEKRGDHTVQGGIEPALSVAGGQKQRIPRQCGGFRLLIAGRFMPAYGCNTRG